MYLFNIPGFLVVLDGLVPLVALSEGVADLVPGLLHLGVVAAGSEQLPDLEAETEVS